MAVDYRCSNPQSAGLHTLYEPWASLSWYFCSFCSWRAHLYCVCTTKCRKNTFLGDGCSKFRHVLIGSEQFKCFNNNLTWRNHGPFIQIQRLHYCLCFGDVLQKQTVPGEPRRPIERCSAIVSVRMWRESACIVLIASMLPTVTSLLSEVEAWRLRFW